MFKQFKEFAFKGNVVDMAVGVMIGGAFGKIVTSAVNDLIMPLISLLTGGLDFSTLFIALDGNTYETLAAAQEAGAACFAYGSFITTVLDFLIMAICVFLMVKGITALRDLKKKDQPAPEPEKAPRTCPYCCEVINEKATRCPHCAAELPEVE
ncbi:MAG: large conductance mechanosensitive channel protein MscL [Clostridiales bacterium]|nr:large conductance mechanosensitive channel protein MscL [Clostridiales bacterium]